MKTAHPYVAFTLLMTGIIATMCILLTQIKATYRDDIRKIDAATIAASVTLLFRVTFPRKLRKLAYIFLVLAMPGVENGEPESFVFAI